MTDPARHLPSDAHVERLALLQADLDDETGEVVAAALEHALADGALDAVAIPTVMKKGRPGMRVEILARPEDAERLEALLLRETSTIGVRRLSVQRTALARREEAVEVDKLPVRVKVALWDGAVLRAKPEFEDCRKVAEATGRPLPEILQRARGSIEENLTTETKRHGEKGKD